MTRDEFRSVVLRGAPKDLPKKALDAALEYFTEEKPPLYEQHVPECIQLASRFATFSDHPSQVDLFPPSSTALVASDLLVEEIRPKVEEVRHEIFGNAEAPFSSLKDAAHWIETAAREQPRPTAEAKREMDCILLKGARLATKYTQLSKQPIRGLCPAVQFLSYAKPGEQRVHKILVQTGPLADLKGKVDFLSKATGFGESVLVAYVLTGIEPVLPLCSIQLSRSWTIGFPQCCNVMVTFYSNDISFEDLRGVYRQLKRQITRVRIGEKERCLLKAVQTLGPGRGKQYWEKVLRLWENPRATEWRSAKVACRRLREKISRLRAVDPETFPLEIR